MSLIFLPVAIFYSLPCYVTGVRERRGGRGCEEKGLAVCYFYDALTLAPLSEITGQYSIPGLNLEIPQPICIVLVSFFFFDG